MSKIVNFSEASSIAIHGMILIARSENPLNVTQIAEYTSSSRHHVAKVMQRLAKEGIIGSSRGPSGGFYLVKKAEDINMLDIYEAIEGKLETRTCPMNKSVCSFESCIFGNVIEKITCDFADFLKFKTLKDYLY